MNDQCIVTDGGETIDEVGVTAGDVILSWEVEQTATNRHHRIVVAPAGDEWVVLWQKRRGRNNEWRTVETHDASEKPTAGDGLALAGDTDAGEVVTDGGEISVSHDFSADDTFTHQKMFVTCTVDEVDDSGHVIVTDQRGGQHQFDREVVNRGLSEGFIQRGGGR